MLISHLQGTDGEPGEKGEDGESGQPVSCHNIVFEANKCLLANILCHVLCMVCIIIIITLF